jgi:hypothetical protein
MSIVTPDGRKADATPRRRAPLTDAEVKILRDGMIRWLDGRGLSYSQIGRVVGRSRATVCRVLNGEGRAGR